MSTRIRDDHDAGTSQRRSPEGLYSDYLNDSGRKLSLSSAGGSLSCPQLHELETASVPLPYYSFTPSSSTELKSHPIKNLQKEERLPWKGISLSKIALMTTFGLGTAVWHYGRKLKVIRWSPGLVSGFVLGTLCGLRYCRKYKNNRKVKGLHGQILGLPLGQNGLFQMTHPHLRRTMSSSEKIQCITRVLKLMWPFYEPNICRSLVEFLNKMLEELKPHFIKRIHLSSLTFGSIPFDITEVRVVKESADEFVLDCDIKWHGNAHVAIMIELRGGGVLHPKFQRLNFYGHARLAFTPLVPYFPGFGAMTICLQSTPVIDFSLDINQTMLSFVGEQVRQFLSSFITDHVFGSVLVWPARIVIPILPERMRGKLNHLELHTRGVLRVVVVEASGLESGESYNGFDNQVKPFVVLETVPLQPLTTKVLPDGHHPVWKEEHFLKVQELDQNLKVELFDDHYDPVTPTLTSIQRHGRKIGSASISLKDLPSGIMVDKWFNLSGVEEPLSRAVRSKHHGQDILSEMWYLDRRPTTTIRLRLLMTYMPVEDLRQGRFFQQGPHHRKSSAHYGLLFVRLLRAYNLENVDYLSLSDPFCVLSLNSAFPKRSRTIKDTLDPEWRENYEWFNVSSKDTLIVEVFSEGRVVDTPLGYIKIPVASIATECERDARGIDAVLTLIDGVGDIHVELDWVPLDRNLMKRESLRQPSVSAFRAAPRGHLFVNLRWASGLRGVGLFGRSHPYCILKVKGNERKSKVMRDTLNPIWNETFIWESVKCSDRIEMDIWAKGTLQDTFLGQLKATVEEATEREGMVVEQCRTLLDRNGVHSGKLTFQIVWRLNTKRGLRHRQRDSSMPQWPTPVGIPPVEKKRTLRDFLFLG